MTKVAQGSVWACPKCVDWAIAAKGAQWQGVPGTGVVREGFLGEMGGSDPGVSGGGKKSRVRLMHA